MDPKTSSKPYRYEEAKKLLQAILDDLKILSGDEIGPYPPWQEVAGTCSANLHTLALRIDAARQGRVVDGPIVFPSLTEMKLLE